MRKGMRGGRCVANDVLPHVAVDYVSYSSYDTINRFQDQLPSALGEALDYLEAKLPPKAGLAGRRVFIGEYGFPLDAGITPERQDELSRAVCRAALVWGCPFALYWELYCNEVRDGRHRGFWLVDDRGREQPFHRTLERYYAESRAWVGAFLEREGRLPTADEFRAAAVRWL